MLKLYGYKKCSSCRKAEKFLQKVNVDYMFIDITENPPSPEELADIAKLANLPLKKLFNASGVQYRELNIKAQLPSISDLEILALLASNGRLIKRPLVTDKKQATVGFKEASFVDVWS